MWLFRNKMLATWYSLRKLCFTLDKKRIQRRLHRSCLEVSLKPTDPSKFRRYWEMWSSKPIWTLAELHLSLLSIWLLMKREKDLLCRKCRIYLGKKQTWPSQTKDLKNSDVIISDRSFISSCDHTAFGNDNFVIEPKFASCPIHWHCFFTKCDVIPRLKRSKHK